MNHWYCVTLLQRYDCMSPPVVIYCRKADEAYSEVIVGMRSNFHKLRLTRDMIKRLAFKWEMVNDPALLLELNAL